MRKSMYILMMFGFALAISKAETKDRPRGNYFDYQNQRIYQAFERGIISYREKRLLKENLNSVLRFKRKALYDNYISKRERRVLNELKNNYERRFYQIVNAPRQYNNGCNTRPVPRKRRHYPYRR